MKQFAKTFERIEKKYLLEEEVCRKFKEAVEPFMQEDQYGLHTICNLYYDTYDYDLIRTSLEKPDYKEKLRVRSYGIPKKDSMVFVEIKKKVCGVVYKRREGMSYRQACNYLQNGMKPGRDSQILREIDYFMKYYQPEPKLFLAYDRRAYFGREDAELRMTFDQRIRSRVDGLNLSAGDSGKQLFDEKYYLLEIKVAGAFPLWLAHILSGFGIFPLSFSKYGTVYKEGLKEQQKEKEMVVYKKEA